MELVLGAVVGFLLLVMVLVSTQRSKAAHEERLRQLHARRRALAVDLRKLQENMQQLKIVEHELRRKLAEADERASREVEVRRQREARQQASRFGSILDVLLHERLLSAEQLAKARSYKDQTRSHYPLSEIVTMLDYVKADVVQRMRQRYPKLSDE
jgi:septal ring factor EnvC (AmiA/AmiB activator)